MEEKTSLHIVEEPKRQELKQICYGIIGCMQEVHNQLGGLPDTPFIRNSNTILYTKARK